MKLHYREVKHNILDVKKDDRKGIHNWGLDNAYPSTMEYLLSASVTAKNCVDKASKALIGKGFNQGDIIINKKGHTLNDVGRALAREYTKHNNSFISVQYNLLGEVTEIEVIPTKHVRVGKRDDKGYNGKYVVYHNWDGYDGKVDPDSFQIVDRYNPDKEVIKAQIEAAGGIRSYKGQVLHIQKYLNEIYSLNDADCVILDMITEINAGEFKQKGTSDGFLNTKIMVVKPFKDEEDRNAFKNDLDSMRGSKNANSVILLESNEEGADLKEQIQLQDLTSEYDDEMFKHSEESAEKAIAKAFNVPLPLINPSDSSIFGNSGEMYKAVKQILWEEKEEERMKIEEALSGIMKRFKDPVEGDIVILKNIEKTVENNE